MNNRKYYRNITAVILAAGSFFLAGCGTWKHEPDPRPMTAERRAAMMRTCQFLKDAGHYFIATEEGDQPRVRPFGTVMVWQDKLYIQTGKKKNVAKQIACNGKVELCALKNGKWIRVSGTLVNDERAEPQKAMLDAYPGLKKLYAPCDGNTQVFYFRNAKAVIYSFDADPVILEF